MYQISTVANYIIQYAITNKLSLSNLKLQKVLYFVQAQFLVNKKSLVSTNKSRLFLLDQFLNQFIAITNFSAPIT